MISEDMALQFDVFSIVALLGIAQGLFLSVILFGMKQGNRRANRILAFLIFVISASIFVWGIVHKTNLKYHLPHLIGTSLPMLFMYGPLYHFYVKALLVPDFRLRPGLLLHFVPVPASILFVLPLYLSDAADKISYVSAGLRSGIMFDNFMIAWFIAVIHINVYTTAAKRVLYGYNDSIKKYYSNIDMINFKWLRIFATLFSLAWYMIFVITVIDTFILKTVFLNNVIPFLVTACFFLFGYLGMVQRDKAVPVKYEKSAMDEERARECLQKVHEYMESARPFLEPDLTLPELADRIGLPRNELSQTINSATGRNFYDFVNKYRVEEMKRLMADPAKRNLTLLGLALDAGFNSKATFNLAFKKHAGMTPGEYMKKMPAAGAEATG